MVCCNTLKLQDNKIEQLIVTRLLAELHEQKISYCHWKSNCHEINFADPSLELDLCIDSTDKDRFLSCLLSLQFKKLEEHSLYSTKGVVHYITYDSILDSLVHLHVYFDLVTGGELVKAFRLPIFKELFESTTLDRGLKIIDKNWDLLLFIIRKGLEHRSLLEIILLKRHQEEVISELNKLLGEEPKQAIDEICSIAGKHLPQIPEDLLPKIVEGLLLGVGNLRLVLNCRKLIYALDSYRVMGRPDELFQRYKRFIYRLFRKVSNIRSGQFRPFPSGKIIAITGADATGKSTLISKINPWLSEYFIVKSFHCGKPASSSSTYIPNLIIKLLRKTKTTSNIRTTKMHMDTAKGSKMSFFQSLIFSVRSVILAIDRHALLKKIHYFRSAGNIALCDRFPSNTPGSMDSPVLSSDILGKQVMSKPIKILSNIEMNYYNSMPSADIVIKLTVPLDVAKARNSNRSKEKKENEPWLEFRHNYNIASVYNNSQVVTIDTSGDIDRVVREAKSHIWKIL